MSKKRIIIGSATIALCALFLFQNRSDVSLKPLQKRTPASLSTTPSQDQTAPAFDFDLAAKKLLFCHTSSENASNTYVYNLENNSFEETTYQMGHCGTLVTGNFDGDAREDFANTNDQSQGPCKLTVVSGEDLGISLEAPISGSPHNGSARLFCDAKIQTIKDKNKDGNEDFLFQFESSVGTFLGYLASSDAQENNVHQIHSSGYKSVFAYDFNSDGREDSFTTPTLSANVLQFTAGIEVFSGPNYSNLNLIGSVQFEPNERATSIVEIKRKGQPSYFAVNTEKVPNANQPANTHLIKIFDNQLKELQSVSFNVTTEGKRTFSTKAIEAADIDGDGVQEIVVIHEKSLYEKEFIFFNTALAEIKRVTGATLTSANGTPVSTNFSIIGTANLNNDLKADGVLNVWEDVNGTWQLQVYLYDISENKILKKITPHADLIQSQSWYTKALSLR